MRQNLTKPIKAALIIYFGILIAFLCHVFFYTDLPAFLQAGITAEKRDYTAGWQLDSGETTDVSEISTGDFGGSFAISRNLPNTILESDAVYFSTSNLRFKLYVDEKQLYSYDTRENYTGIGDGSAYHIIGRGTKDEDAGRRG